MVPCMVKMVGKLLCIVSPKVFIFSVQCVCYSSCLAHLYSGFKKQPRYRTFAASVNNEKLAYVIRRVSSSAFLWHEFHGFIKNILGVNACYISISHGWVCGIVFVLSFTLQQRKMHSHWHGRWLIILVFAYVPDKPPHWEQSWGRVSVKQVLCSIDADKHATSKAIVTWWREWHADSPANFFELFRFFQETT